jgi:DNA-binding NarL/FixJ family response regulator
LTIRVAIADDQKLVRAGFRVLVDSAPDMTVVGEATTGRDAVQLVGESHPDVVLMDIRMPDLDGIEATRLISGSPALAGTRILILTTFETDDDVVEAMRAGASGYLLKDAEPSELLDAIRVVAQGEALLAPSVTRRLIAAFVASSARQPSPPSLARLDTLTDREREVLVLIANGLNNAEIADVLFVSVATAKTHINRIMTKLDARDRAQLVVIAYENGLVTPSSTAP